MKRPASFAAREAKRAAKASGDLKHRCEEVSSALLAATASFPLPVLEMLSSNIADSLGIVKDNRHPFQEQVATMIGEVLDAVSKVAQAKVAKAQSELSDLTATKDELENAEQSAMEELNVKVEATNTAMTAAAGTSDALIAAEAALADAQAALAETRSVQDTDASKKSYLSTMLSEKYVPLKEGTLEGSATKGIVSEVVHFGKECSLDATLLSTLPTALSKAPADRGTFDKLVLEQLSEMFSRAIDDLEAKITKLGVTIGDQQAKVDEATDKLDKAKVADQEAKAAVDAAKASQKQATASRSEAKANLKAAGPAIKDATAALQEAECEASALQAGPMKAYQALMELSLAPEEPEPAAAAPVPTEEELVPAQAAAEEEQPAA
uniref:Uncharacterized protein n=1 Tax=Alexandrium andersonii TaxID=327968 RepID=A0A7S2BFT7_9DINO